jgi:hypothetical protein
LSLLRDQLDEINTDGDDDKVDEIAENFSLDPSQSVGEYVNDLPELRGKLLFHGHITLRSQQPARKLSSMEDSFRTGLSVWLGHELARLEVPLLCAVNFGPDDFVSNASVTHVSVSLIPCRLPNTDHSRSSTSLWLTSINTSILFIVALAFMTANDATS